MENPLPSYPLPSPGTMDDTLFNSLFVADESATVTEKSETTAWPIYPSEKPTKAEKILWLRRGGRVCVGCSCWALARRFASRLRALPPSRPGGIPSTTYHFSNPTQTQQTSQVPRPGCPPTSVYNARIPLPSLPPSFISPLARPCSRRPHKMDGGCCSRPRPCLGAI